MSGLKIIWDEFIGLFVDDVGFAVAIAVWLVAMAALFRLGVVPGVWRGPLLFAGLAAVFIENTLRRSRK